jgi:hypothetical protein
VHFLKDWLGAEILDVDMKFAPFLKGKGGPWKFTKNRAGHSPLFIPDCLSKRSSRLPFGAVSGITDGCSQ